jgi:hypothetical protein
MVAAEAGVMHSSVGRNGSPECEKYSKLLLILGEDKE